MMVVLLAVLVTALVTVAECGVIDSLRSFPPGDEWETVHNTNMIIEGVVEQMTEEKCSLLLFSDGVIPLGNLIKYVGNTGSKWGLGVFEVNGQNMNKTQIQFPQVVAQARKMRRISWCMMIVVLSDDQDFLVAFAEWSIKGRLLVWSTRLLLVTQLPRADVSTLLASHWTYSMMSTMAIYTDNFTSNQSLRILYLGRYGLLTHLPFTTKEARVVQVASWTENTGLITLKSHSIFPQKYLNFHGATINVTALPYEPYWMTSVKDNTTRYSGTDYNQLMALGKTLNFKFRVLSSSNWPEVTDQVEARTSFLASVIYAVLPNRLLIWDYTYAFEENTFSFAMAKPVLKPSWLSFFYPLTGEVWAAILVSSLIVSLTLITITSSELWMRKHGSISAGSVILEIVGSLLGQGLCGHLSTCQSNHILVGCWLVFGVVVSTGYRGSLIASLNFPRLPPRPETLEELVNTVDRVTYESYGSYYKKIFMTSESKVLQAFGNMLYLGVSTIDGLNDALTNKRAHINSRVYLEITVAQNFMNVDGSTSIYIGKERILPAKAGWPVPHDAPYKHIFDKIIVRIGEAGLFNQWKKETLDEFGRVSREKQRNKINAEKEMQKDVTTETVSDNTNQNTIPLNLTHMQGPFLLLLLGLLLAILEFAGEIILFMLKI